MRYAFLVPQSIDDSSGQLPGIGGGGVHLPVADNGFLLDAVHHHEATAWTKDGSSGKAPGRWSFSSVASYWPSRAARSHLARW